MKRRSKQRKQRKQSKQRSRRGSKQAKQAKRARRKPRVSKPKPGRKAVKPKQKAAVSAPIQKAAAEVPTLEQVTITCANCGRPFRVFKLKGLSLEGTICQRCSLGEVELPESFG